LLEHISSSNEKGFQQFKNDIGEIDNAKVVSYLLKYFKAKNISFTTSDIWQPETNKTQEAFNINIYLENNKPQKVSFLNKYEGTAYPMRKADHESLKLRKFKWLDSIRPKSKADLLQYAPVVIPLAEKNTSNDKPKNN
jgi:hypothetical protein